MGLTTRGGWPFDRALVREPLLGSRVCTSSGSELGGKRLHSFSQKSSVWGGRVDGLPKFRALRLWPQRASKGSGFAVWDFGIRNIWVLGQGFSRIRVK